jgi:hypothetical protein
MRLVLVCVLTVVPAMPLAAQQRTKPPKTVSLSGCVVPDLKTPGQFDIVETTTREKYHVTGKDFREYVGRLVQVDGGIDVGGLKVKGGLHPSPNVAAQAGAMDPSRAAVAAAVAERSTGTVELQEFKVKTIHPTGGACPAAPEEKK